MIHHFSKLFSFIYFSTPMIHHFSKLLSFILLTFISCHQFPYSDKTVNNLRGDTVGNCFVTRADNGCKQWSSSGVADWMMSWKWVSVVIAWLSGNWYLDNCTISWSKQLIPTGSILFFDLCSVHICPFFSKTLNLHLFSYCTAIMRSNLSFQ